MAFKPVSLFPRAGQAGQGAGGDSKLSPCKQLLLSYRDARPVGPAPYWTA
jgi:hypothetical protein